METISYKSTIEIRKLLPAFKSIVRELVLEDENMYFDTLLIIGIINRTYELTESALWAIDNERPLTTFNMLRALFETLGFVYYSMGKLDNTSSSQKYDEVASNLFLASKADGSKYQAINILTCIDCASKVFIELRKQYEEISELVHPNAASHACCAEAKNGSDHIVEFGMPFYKFKGQDKKGAVNRVGECCNNIQSLCKTIIVNSSRKKLAGIGSNEVVSQSIPF